MKEIKSVINLIIVSLDDKFARQVGEELANKLDMHFADLRDLIAYDIADPKFVEEKCGIEYLKSREAAVVKNCAGYYDTVITISFELLKEHINKFSNSFITYISLPQDKIRSELNKIAYENRDDFLKQNADNVVTLEKRSKAQATTQVLDRLGEVL